MQAYITSVFSAVLIATIISMIVPNKKLFKFIKSFLSIFVMIVILKPILYYNGEFITNGVMETNYIFSDLTKEKEYITFIYDKKNEENVSVCSKILNDLELYDTKTLINYQIDEDMQYKIKNIKIFLSKTEFNNTKQHKIIIETAVNKISETFSIEKEKILIYDK